MRTRLLLALALALSLIIPASPAHAGSPEELTAEKRADIVALMRQSGSEGLALSLSAGLARQITTAVKTARPDVPGRVLDIVERELVRMLAEKMGGPQGLMARMVPAYAEAFSHEEVRQLLAFYQSPLGRKAVSTVPRLMAQGQRIGQEMARELQPELRERLSEALKREGIELKGKSGPVLDQMPGQPAGPGPGPGTGSGTGDGAQEPKI